MIKNEDNPNNSNYIYVVWVSFRTQIGGMMRNGQRWKDMSPVKFAIFVMQMGLWISGFISGVLFSANGFVSI